MNEIIIRSIPYLVCIGFSFLIVVRTVNYTKSEFTLIHKKGRRPYLGRHSVRRDRRERSQPKFFENVRKKDRVPLSTGEQMNYIVRHIAQEEYRFAARELLKPKEKMCSIKIHNNDYKDSAVEEKA